jgi:predicted esterase
MRSPWLLVLLALVLASAGSRAAAAPGDDAKASLEMLKSQPVTVETIFSGDKFPAIKLLNQNLVEAAAGPVTQRVRWFDAQWNEVTAPAAPGRYGAIVTFSAGNFSWAHRITLYKTPKPYLWANDRYQMAVQLPAAFGIPPDVVAQQQWNIGIAFTRVIGPDEGGGDYLAKIAAGLNDIAADPARWSGFSYFYLNTHWWSELGRHIGENQDYHYLSYLPPDYDKDSTTHWPLLLFLHGSGERGSDLNAVKIWGPLAWIEKGHPQPMIVIEPQCPEEEWWDPVRLARLLDKVAAEKRVDPKRIYVTGLSMGGYGTFEFAAEYPERVAAIAPLSGGEDPALASRLKSIPAWIFHGADDMTVPASESIDLAQALQKLGAPVKLTVYPGVGHEKWDVTYGDPALYSWLLAQSK